MDHHNHHHDHGAHGAPLSDADLPVEHRGGGDGGLLLTDDHSHFHGGGSSGNGDASGGHSSAAHHMMKMYFNFGSDGDPILFSFWNWKSNEVSTILISVVIIFVLSFLYEGLKVYREKLFKDAIRSSSISLASKDQNSGNSNGNGPVIKSSAESVRVRILSTSHFYQTFLHIVQVTVSFLLMLIFMTYNVWLCLAVVFGAGFGYLVFGWKRSFIGYDVTEHCH